MLRPITSQDTSRVNVEMDAHPGPRLSVKVAYYLTDLVEDSQGPTWVVVRPPSSSLPSQVLVHKSSCDAH